MIPIVALVLVTTVLTIGGQGHQASETLTSPDDPPAMATAFSEPGPYPVGATTFAVDDGQSFEVWYPAAETATGEVGYDVRDFVPRAIRDLLTADIPASYTYPGARDVAVAPGRFPVVLFSHGFSGIRVQSSFLTSHLASHGMIVAAPDHPSRDLFNTLSQTASGDQADAVDDLFRALDLLVLADATTGGPFDGRVDAARVGLVGHSAGGGTVIAAALDERVAGYVSMAAGGPAEGAEYPDTPSLFLAGSLDAVVPVATATRPGFDAAPAPSWYAEIEATGHQGFADFCTFGDGTGIIGIAEASGLGPLLDTQPQFRRLGEDGCIPPAAPVEQAFPIVRHTTTSFLRWVFGEDADPVGLDATIDGAYELGVTFSSR